MDSDISNKMESGSYTTITGTGTGTTTNYVATSCISCIHKLPCGFCTMLNRICPMQYTPTWGDGGIKITCEATT